MKVKEFMERIGTNQTGRALAYIKDGMEEIAMLTEVHIDVQKSNIVSGTRFYDYPGDMIKVLDIRCKNHLNSKDEYRSIPRLMRAPVVKDSDNV
jgi:hypothetical protein|tara:strand:- start:1655 stop:1936 length:282 start_codon:yes stop_codon:yes gene_type:complete